MEIGPYISIHSEYSFHAVYNYLLEILICMVLILIFVKAKSPIYIILAGIFLFITGDDLYQIHERVTYYLHHNLDMNFLVYEPLIQLMVLSSFGIILISLLVYFMWKASINETLFSILVFEALLLLRIASIIFDFLGSERAAQLGVVWGLAEEGGEAAAVIVVLTLAMVQYKRINKTTSCDRSRV